MFEKWRIKEHMEVADSTGRHLGTVDEVEDNRIKLTRTDSTDGSHHYLDWESVDRIEDNRVYLKAGTQLPTGGESRDREMAGAGSSAATNAAMGGSGAGMGSGSAATDAALGSSSSANLTGSQGAAKLPGEDNALFGTSGHGTGMGGSGTN